MEVAQLEDQKEKRMNKNEGNLKCTNIRIIGVPEGEEREKGMETLFEEIMAENFPNLAKETDIQVQESQKCKRDEPKETHTKTHYN